MASHRIRRRGRIAIAASSSLLVLLALAASALGPRGDRPLARQPLALSLASGSSQVGFTSSDPRTVGASRDSERQSMGNAAGQQVGPPVGQQSRQSNGALTRLARSAEKAANKLATNTWVLPTVGYTLTAGFGMTSRLWASFHTGLDFAAPTGTPIFAVASGVILQTGWAGPYGNRTVEGLPDGTELWYAHQSEIGVRAGQSVLAGQTIGKIGATGNTTGPHLHLEVRPGGGDPVDPFAALVFHGLHP